MISKANTKIPIKVEIFNEKNHSTNSKKNNLTQLRNPTSTNNSTTSIKLIKTNKTQEETRVVETRINQQQNKNLNKNKHNVQNLSPIKPSFVSSREDNTTNNINNIIPINSQMNFAHSTPNHHQSSIPKILPIYHATPKKTDNESASKKQLIVKELAVNILELNGYRTRTEQLDTELKNFSKLKKERSGRDYASISEQSEGIHNELEKLKVEMLQKIEDIHKLESELIKLEGHNSFKTSSNQRNEEVMSEIRTMLREMVENSGQNSSLSSNRIYEEYSRTMKQFANTSPTLQLKKIESDFIETGEIYRKYHQFRTQIEQDCCFLLNQAKDLEFRLKTLQSVEQSMNEIEKFKNSVRIMEDNLEKGKFYLFRDLDCLNTTQSNRLLITNLKGRIEKLLLEKHTELETVIKGLITVINKTNHDSSFLTEEEEAIRKISDRIKVLKAKIDAKDSLPVFSKRYKKNRNYSDGSSDDTDTKELKHLNEQIKFLKGKMLAKGDQLNQMKMTSSDLFQNQTSSHTVFLPINHIRNSDNLSSYRIEPLELYDECTSEYIASDNFQNDLILVKDEQKKYEKKIIYPIEQEYDEDRTSYRDLRPKNNQIYYDAGKNDLVNSGNKKYTSSIEPTKNNQIYYVAGKNDLVNSGDKKYTSSIEIPADQLENFKNGLRDRRSRSENSSRKTSTSDEEECASSRSKRAKSSVVQFKNPLSVSLKSVKRPGPEKETMTDGNKSDNEKYQKEIDELKKIVSQKNEIINRQHDQQRQLDELKANELKINAQKNEILNRRLQEQNEEIQLLKNQLNDVLIEREKLKEAKSDDALVCNIPEHHKLEDMNHQMKIQLNKLRNFIRDTRSDKIEEVDLAEKKAEFEALDLAINERKQQLLKLEMAKNMQLNQQFYLDKDQSMIKDEIYCLEDTLKKRSIELHDVEKTIKTSKKDLMCLKNSKIRIEKECELIKKKNSKLKKEMELLNKKADDAAMHLISVQEELNFIKEEKSEMETCIETMKTEMINFLQEVRTKDINQKNQQIKFNNYSLNELKHNIFEQKNLLNTLNNEIESKKKEIQILKEKGSDYTDAFKADIEQSQKELNNLKNSKENLLNHMSQIKTKFENCQSELMTKTNLLEEKKFELNQIDKDLNKLLEIKEQEEKKLSEIEKYLKEKKSDCDEMDAHLDKLRQNEEEYFKNLDELRSSIEAEKSNFNELKNTNDELNSLKIELKNKISSLNEILEKIDQECEIREVELKNFNTLAKEKQLAIKRLEDEIADLGYEKETLVQDVNKLNEKVKNKKIEFDKVEDSYKQVEAKLIQSQNELNNLAQKNIASKKELESMLETLKEYDLKLKDMTNKNQNKQNLFDQLNEKCLEKKDELDTLESYLEELKNEYQNEKRQLNSLQVNLIYVNFKFSPNRR
ncbi:unnamed protein product [Brachionus calyciflorus]|uniref:Uncharacterized protein n=1 Tax=Brachionus calyciflorus TaxID=104777 RepID=A0A813WGD3_9BILA|nr:unnamed protein product [Brachionus calyciflorus]